MAARHHNNHNGSANNHDDGGSHNDDDGSANDDDFAAGRTADCWASQPSDGFPTFTG